jgi:hypothetical protein
MVWFGAKPAAGRFRLGLIACGATLLRRRHSTYAAGARPKGQAEAE